MTKPFIQLAIGVSLVLGAAGGSHASLIDDTVSCSSTTSDLTCTPGSAVVGSGIEFLVEQAPGSYLWRVDLASSSITLVQDFGDFLGTSPGDNLTLSDLDWVGFPAGKIIGVSLSGISGVVDLTLSDLSFTDHSVTVDLSSTQWFRDAQATINLEVTHGTPEPPILVLMGLGLAGIGYGQRRSKIAK